MFVAEDTDGSVIGFVSVGSRLHWSGETDAYVGELAVAECASSLVTCAASVLVAIHGELCYVVWEKVRSVPDQAQRMPVMADRRRGVWDAACWGRSARRRRPNGRRCEVRFSRLRELTRAARSTRGSAREPLGHPRA